MISNFNTVMNYSQIVEAYKNNTFPNAHCLLWDHEDNVELLSEIGYNNLNETKILKEDPCDRRSDPGSGRSGALPHEPFDRKNGLCAGTDGDAARC